MLTMVSRRNTDAGSYGKINCSPCCALAAARSSDSSFSLATVRSWASASKARTAATSASGSSCLPLVYQYDSPLAPSIGAYMIWEYSSSRRQVEMQSMVQRVFSISESVASGISTSVLELYGVIR